MRYPYITTSVPYILIAVCVLFTLLAIGMHMLSKKNIKIPTSIAFTSLAIALLARIYIAYKTEGHPDITTFFLPWSDKLVNGDFFAFYMEDVAAGTIYTLGDYAPMIMYPIALIGYIVKVFALSETAWIFLMRVPAMVCDIVASWYILKLAVLFCSKRPQKEYKNKRKEWIDPKTLQNKNAESKLTIKNFPKQVPAFAFFAMLLYAFNPSLITDSAWWGQVDGVTAMFLVLALYNVYQKKDKAVVIIAVLALCFKLQYIFFMPALGMYYLVRLAKEKMQLFSELLKGVAIGVVCFLAINLPLCIVPMTNGHPFFMIDIYINQVSSYGYYTLNAPNLFGALNLNFVTLPNSGSAYTIFLVLICCVVVALCSLFGNGKRKIAVFGALTIITVFMFSYKMHERYMIYALILLLIVYAESGKLSDLLVYCGFTCVQFYTIASIMCIEGNTFDFSDKRLQIISIICLTLYFLYVILLSQAEITARDRKTK